MSPIVLGFALLALVLTVSALLSGLIERAPLSFPMRFFGLGLLMGERGLGLLPLDVHHPTLEIIATLSLALVLFLDAVNMQVDELRQDWRVPLLTLGPGTLLTVTGVAGAASLLLGTPPLHALLLGAILSSTDPVVLRDVLRNDQIPRSVRRALGVEAGMNDLVVLPIVLILIAVLQANVGGLLAWLRFLAQLLVLSPLVGLAVGGIGAWVMGKVDARFGIRWSEAAQAEPAADWKGVTRLAELRLLNAVQTLRVRRGTGTDQGLRNHALLAALLGSGLRVSEVLNLERDQYTGKGFTRVLAKGGVDPRSLCRCIGRRARPWTNGSRHGKDNSPALFLTRTGRKLSRREATAMIPAGSPLRLMPISPRTKKLMSPRTCCGIRFCASSPRPRVSTMPGELPGIN